MNGQIKHWGRRAGEARSSCSQMSLPTQIINPASDREEGGGSMKAADTARSPQIIAGGEDRDRGTDLSNGQLDLVWGAEAIGASLGISTRRTYYLLENREIPGRKVGGRWVVRRSRLGRFFDHSA